MKHRIFPAAAWKNITIRLLMLKLLRHQFWINSCSIVSYVMSHAVVMAHFERLQTCGKNGSYNPKHFNNHCYEKGSFLFHLNFGLNFFRNVGLGNGVHSLQLQIAMRGDLFIYLIYHLSRPKSALQYYGFWLDLKFQLGGQNSYKPWRSFQFSRFFLFVPKNNYNMDCP